MTKKYYTDWDQIPVVVDLATAAVILNLSYDCLQKLSRTGKFPAFRNGNRKWAVTKDSLLTYVRNSNRKED